MYSLEDRGNLSAGPARATKTEVGNQAAEPLARLGGVHKPSEFVNSGAPNSSGISEASVHKLDPAVNAHRGVQNDTAAVGQLAGLPLVPMEPAAPSIPALVPLGSGGRPKILTPELTEKLYLLLSVGFSRRQAAAYLGIAHSAISNAAARNSEFAAELRRAEELTALQSEMTLMAAARKNWKAAAWYLTFKAKNPPPPSEEEKQEQHLSRLADQRRSAELRTNDLLDMGAALSAVSQQSRTAAPGESPEELLRKMKRTQNRTAK